MSYTNEQIALLAAVQERHSGPSTHAVVQTASAYLEWLNKQTEIRTGFRQPTAGRDR